MEYSDAPVDDARSIPLGPAQNTDELIAAMTLQEAADFLRPRAELGHYEYVLGDADALEFARVIQEDIRSRIPGSDEVGQAGDADEREDRSVISGWGNWSQINASAANSPYSKIASMDQGAGTCTTEKMINQYTSVTAAHCVKNTSGSWTTRQRLRFRAGSANTSNGGTGNALGYISSGCYWRITPGCFTGEWGVCDYAVFKLRGNGAWCAFDDYNVGWFGYTTVNNEYSSMTVRTSGYPSTPPSGSYPGLSYHRRTDGKTANDDWVFYRNDTNGGQSGGAVFNDSNKMRAIHSGNDSSSWNIGMRLTTTVVNFFSSNAGS